jgi:diamine N-acetyltransferase
MGGSSLGFMTVELREIDEVVLTELRASVLLPPEQQEYVGGTVDDALAEAAAYPEANPWPRGVYADGVPVGLVMLSWDLHPDPPDPTLVGPWFLWKLMVSHDQQGHGYGRAIIAAVAEVIRPAGATELLTSYSLGEGDPSGFYASVGFVPTGDLHEGEVVAALAL